MTTLINTRKFFLNYEIKKFANAFRINLKINKKNKWNKL